MSDDKMEMEMEMDPVAYSKLQDLEDEFEEVEVELLRQQAKLSAGLYEKRAKVIADIGNFWPLVLEQSPPELDEVVQPTDSSVLLNNLKGVNVERFELPTGGDPRSVAITLTFSDNEYFSNTTLTKKFWWRYAKDGWSGLVSEPVPIQWKSKDKDLTQGMLDLVCRVREAERKAGKKLEEDEEPKKELLAKMEATALGGVSFFAWFGYCGRDVSEAESKEAFKEEQAKREKRKAGEEVPEDDDEEDDLDEYETEIFPTGDDVAICFSEDVWPNAIKYFITALEHEALSDVDFESDEEMEEADDEHANKKRKA